MPQVRDWPAFKKWLSDLHKAKAGGTVAFVDHKVESIDACSPSQAEINLLKTW